MQRFIIGTGRCGSTLLTTMLGRHPDLMVLSEFFVTLDAAERFADTKMTGPEFADFLQRPNTSLQILVERGIVPKEVMIAPAGKESVPPLLISTLPMISENPLALYDEVLMSLRKFPAQKLACHYLDLFAWLQDRASKSAWVERSGPSANYVHELVDMFPDAKYLHLHRDGLETATSFMTFPSFQLDASFHHDPPTVEELLATEFGDGSAHVCDTLTRRLSPSYLTPQQFGEYWSYQESLIFQVLPQLNRDQYFDIRYEDLVTSPREALAQIAKFFELSPTGPWVEEAAAMVSGGLPPLKSEQLSPAAQEQLRRGCRPGQLLLGRETGNDINDTFNAIRGLSRKSVDA